MLNLDLSDVESSVLCCVNPYDVNPITYTTQATYKEKGNLPLGDRVKLEMEEFSDLAPYLPESAPKVMSSSIDELNTPIFDEKGPFDFAIYENKLNAQPSTAGDHFKFEYDILTTGNSVLSNKQLSDVSVCPTTSDMNIQVQQNVHNKYSELVNNNTAGSEANLIFSTSEDQADIYIINESETPMHAQIKDRISAFKSEDNNSVISAGSNECQYSNVSSPSNEYSVKELKVIGQYSNAPSPNDGYFNNNNLGVETPEDSNSCPSTEHYARRTCQLRLNLERFGSQPASINTPDVIDSVVDLEDSFNILDYINEKHITTVNVEDIHFEDPSTTKGIPLYGDNIDLGAKSRKRKTKRYDDDDEDYVPPSKKQSTSKKTSVYNSESDSDDDIADLVSKRGRPARRPSSISSEHSDASKYRELRDKNNEASRKSRLKRKMKEMNQEKEAEELVERNIKLKTQVEELQKMVDTFKSNLFKIMLKK